MPASIAARRSNYLLNRCPHGRLSPSSQQAGRLAPDHARSFRRIDRQPRFTRLSPRNLRVHVEHRTGKEFSLRERPAIDPSSLNVMSSRASAPTHRRQHHAHQQSHPPRGPEWPAYFCICLPSLTPLVQSMLLMVYVTAGCNATLVSQALRPFHFLDEKQGPLALSQPWSSRRVQAKAHGQDRTDRGYCYGLTGRGTLLHSVPLGLVTWKLRRAGGHDAADFRRRCSLKQRPGSPPVTLERPGSLPRGPTA